MSWSLIQIANVNTKVMKPLTKWIWIFKGSYGRLKGVERGVYECI